MDFDEIRQLKESLELEKKRRLEAEKSAEFEKMSRVEAEKSAEFEKMGRVEAEKSAELEKKRRLEAESKLRTIKYMRFKSRSSAQIYKDFYDTGSFTNCGNLGLPQVNQAKIVDAWNKIITRMEIFEEGKNERTQVHPIIKITLEAIIEKLELSKIKFHYESRLQNPCFSPDFSLTTSKIAEPSWPDCLSFIECKATDIPVSEGGRQAISYLTHLVIPDTLDISKMNELTFSAQTNGRSIQFFVFKKTGPSQCDHHFTSELTLFGTESNAGTPSDGFKVLCQFMSYLEKSSIPEEVVQINGKPYNVIKTFQKCEALIVGMIDLGRDGGRCVAKFAINHNKRAIFMIHKEALIYNILKNSPVKTLELSALSSFNQLIFLNVGKGDLKSWGYDIIYANQGDPTDDYQFVKIVKCFIEIFDQIKALHEFGFTHCDIRPANILILEDDSPCLIDFVTVTKIGSSFDFFPGTLVYMAEKLLISEKNSIFTYKCKYDMESFFYSILDCVDRHYSTSFLRSCIDLDPNNINTNFNEKTFACLRKSRLDNLRASNGMVHFKNSKFVELFFKLFDKLSQIPNDLDLSQSDYVDLRQILVSFLEKGETIASESLAENN